MDEPGGEQKRAAKRVPVDIYADLEHQGQLKTVRVVDISVGGALLDCPGYEWPETGSAVMLRISLGGPRLQLLARLVRRVGDHCAGLAFEALGGDCDRALARYVLQREMNLHQAHKHITD
jgi:hypothetical protein